MRDYQHTPDKTGLPIPDWKTYPVKRLYCNVFTPEKLKRPLALMNEAYATVQNVSEKDMVNATEKMKQRERVRRLCDFLLLSYADSVLANSR